MRETDQTLNNFGKLWQALSKHILKLDKTLDEVVIDFELEVKIEFSQFREKHSFLAHFFFLPQRACFTNIEFAIGGKSSRERFWKNSSQCREILLQVK